MKPGNEGHTLKVWLLAVGGRVGDRQRMRRK